MNSHNSIRVVFRYSLVLLLVAVVTITADWVVPIAYASNVWTNNQAANVVLGQSNFTSSASGTTATTMNNPIGVAVDPTSRKVFISDISNHRVLRFSSASALVSGSAAEAVLGQADFTSGLPNRGGAAAANTMAGPVQVVVDSGGRLWVAEESNSRVLRFDNAAAKNDGANADGVLGQADFTSAASNRGGTVAANTVSVPDGVWVDAAGTLWVGDSSNNRVLRFDNAASKSNGANADGVLGQPNFTSNTVATTQNGMRYVPGIIVNNTGTLFVADRDNNRVLRFDNASAKANGAAADGVLGQLGFTSNATATTQSGFNSPAFLALDNDGHLYVADRSNNRILMFNNAATKPNGANADNVLGQPDFTTATANTGGISASTLSGPRQPFFDNAANVLWVADRFNNRVLRYTPTVNLFLPLLTK